MKCSLSLKYMYDATNSILTQDGNNADTRKKMHICPQKGKACHIDAIPVEVLCNVTSVSFLHILFNICFD